MSQCYANYWCVVVLRICYQFLTPPIFRLNKLECWRHIHYETYRTGKVGGATKLSSSQSNSLERQQIMEFKKRYKPKVTTSGLNRLPGNYANRSNTDSRAELVVCVDSKGDCIGCAGVEGKLYTYYAGFLSIEMS